MLCDVAAGGLDGIVDSGPHHAPWDYLGGYLACIEAGAVVRDANGDELVTDDPNARRQLIAAGTPALADALDADERPRMSALDLDALLVAADRAARAGGEIVRAHFGAPPDVREKAPGDWVTAADVASEDAVRAVLERETGLPVFGEEAGGERADTGWLVDPLDGTSNFVHGFDAVGVSVGLVADGEPVVGVVHAPLLDRTLRGAQGWGRVPRRAPDPRERPRRPSRRSSPPGSRSGTRSCCAGTSRRSPPRSTRSRTCAGSAAPASTCAGPPRACSTATSSSRLGPWDVAAGALIVREAGGVVTDWARRPGRVARERQHPRRPARTCTRCWREIASAGRDPADR